MGNEDDTTLAPDKSSDKSATSGGDKGDRNALLNATSAAFGKWLREQRLERKISLEEIAAVTKIHISHLRCIEEGDREKFLAAPFMRGFLVNYARHIGLDQNDVLGRYKNSLQEIGVSISHELIAPKGTRAARSRTHPQVSIVTSPNFKQAPGTQNMEEEVHKVVNMQNITIIVAAGLLIVVIGYLISLGKRESARHKQEAAAKAAASQQSGATTAAPATATPQESAAAALVSATATVNPQTVPPATTEPSTESAEQKHSAENSEKAAEKTTETASTAAAVGDYKLQIKALEQSWVNVRIDDGDNKGILLKLGSVYDFSGKRRAQLALSNAGGVEIAWNGVWYAAPGYRGDVTAISLPDQLGTLKKRGAPDAASPTKTAPAGKRKKGSSGPAAGATPETASTAASAVTGTSPPPAPTTTSNGLPVVPPNLSVTPQD